MPLFNNLKIILIKYIKIFLNRYDTVLEKNKPLCHIEQIDMVKKIIIIYSRGVSAPIKFTFNEIIQDIVVISNLSSQQASWIGYYYGLFYYYESKSPKTNMDKIDFSFSESKKGIRLNIKIDSEI